MRQADGPRADDRARIIKLFNGSPPYTEQEAKENRIAINVNHMESIRLAHDARSQFFGAFLKPGVYFHCHTDMGVRSRRAERGAICTSEINKIMKRSLPYFECYRSKFASNVLFGIGPACWDNESSWCPDPIGVGDVMIPARTYLTMKNLPFFALYHSYTAPELIRLTRGPKVDPAWNMELVDHILRWIDKQTLALMGSNWPEIWSPEKLQERLKGDGGFYSADAVPTIDVWDVYAWEDDGETSGFERRMILDAWSMPEGGSEMARRADMSFAKGQWLYNPGRRKFADKLSEIISFQFADLSANAPFQYHSVRSLGFLLYAVCTLQNRLRCKFSEAVFENMMQMFRVKSMDDVQRVLKLNLTNFSFLDETVQVIPQAERHQINAQLVELGLTENSRLINENAQSYRAANMSDDGQKRKTKAQVMAELTATTALVQAGLIQAYEYQKGEDREILRRFFRPNSRDPEVREFRANVMRRGIPEKMLTLEAWETEHERVMGSGNKALELQIAETLMQARQLYDPDAQRKILRDFTLATTDDPGRAMDLVPEVQTKVTDSVHDAQLASGALLQGLPVAVKSGYNHGEYVQTVLGAMAAVIAKAQKRGGMATADEIAGLQNMAQHVSQHLAILAQNKDEKANVKKFGDALGKMMNLVKGFAQRLQQQAQAAQQNGNGKLDPKDAAKIQATIIGAQVKAENQSKAQAQRAAQRQLQFERELKQKQQEHGMEMQHEHQRQAHEMAVNRVNGRRSMFDEE